ncbi:MAG: fibrobacter succinogenes major paralogous domain-containing protein [Fibrobacter sp.]|nr:fibrobacter succinogenes major paralogous domain-containing protein [Fibrobacter sp.]
MEKTKIKLLAKVISMTGLVLIFAACGDDSNPTNTEQTNTEVTSLVDVRDGKTYKITTIRSQIWMAENLNYETADSYCYGDVASNCAIYGRLYSWFDALTACPSGWHLPDSLEFKALFLAVGGRDVAGKLLKSTTGWDSNGNGTDDYSFSALPAGFYDGVFRAAGSIAYFWSSTERSDGNASIMLLDFAFDRGYFLNFPKPTGLSVRCLKD